MLLFRGSEDLGAFGEIGDEGEDEEGDDDREDSFENEDPAPAFLSLDAVHVTDAVGEEAGNAGAEHAEGEEGGEADGGLFAGIVFGNE